MGELNPPSNIEIEAALLGALLINPVGIENVKQILTPEDFYDPIHRRIYTSMLDLHAQQKPVDYLTLAEYLSETNALDEIGGIDFLASLATVPPTALHLDSYARIVADLALRRRVLGAASQIAQLAFDQNLPLETILQSSEQVLAEAWRGRESHRIVGIRQATEQFIKKLQAQREHKDKHIIRSGFISLDAVIAGFQEGNLIVVAGRPGTGKTTFLLNLAYHAAVVQRRRVLFWSLEMSIPQLTYRLLARASGIPVDNIRSGTIDEEDLPRLHEFARTLSDAAIFLDERANLSPRQAYNIAASLRKQEGLDLVIIDYLQLMQSDEERENRVLEIGDITIALKRIAAELGIPVIVGSQVSRAVEQRADKRPLLSDLKESGTIEQDADLVLMLYREEIYQEDTPKKGLVDVIVAKHRMGDLGSVVLHFDPGSATFSDISTS